VDDELEELRLWEIGKEIGVVCKDCEDSILQQLAEMEERDNRLMREPSLEEGNPS